MEKAAAYAISAFIVGFGLWILIAGLSSIAPSLWALAALIPIAIGFLSAFGPTEIHPFRGDPYTCVVLPAALPSNLRDTVEIVANERARVRLQLQGHCAEAPPGGRRRVHCAAAESARDD